MLIIFTGEKDEKKKLTSKQNLFVEKKKGVHRKKTKVCSSKLQELISLVELKRIFFFVLLLWLAIFLQ